MKWPSLDESVSLCICVLTVACNFEMQPSFFFLLLAIRCGGGGILESGWGSIFNCADRIGSADLGYRPCSVFSLKPVQTSNLYLFLSNLKVYAGLTPSG